MPNKTKTHNLAFGKALRALRVNRKFTQESLGFEAGFDRTYISLLERGINSPTLDTIFALCVALRVTFSEFSQCIAQELYGKDPG